MQHKATRVLLIEDDHDHADLVLCHLEGERERCMHCHWVPTLQEGIDYLSRESVDAVLLDLRLPDSTISDTLPRMLRCDPEAPIIVLTSLNDLELALHAVQQGAQDYLDKGQLSSELLLRAIHYAIERKRHAAELERSNRELQQFAHIVSHELKSPLSAVMYFCEILSRKYGTTFDAEMLDFIQKTKNSVRGMAELVNDLMKYASVNGHSQMEVVATAQAVHDATDNLKPLISQSGARITHDDLPSVRGNSTQLRQLFQNLIDNALKYRSASQPTIHVSATRSGDFWQFAVQDNGIGIAPQYQERIFSIFERVLSEEHPSGSGIGLALCKRIVERHGGRIWVASQPAQGSTFFFTLPAAA